MGVQEGILYSINNFKGIRENIYKIYTKYVQYRDSTSLYNYTVSF